MLVVGDAAAVNVFELGESQHSRRHTLNPNNGRERERERRRRRRMYNSVSNDVCIFLIHALLSNTKTPYHGLTHASRAARVEPRCFAHWRTGNVSKRIGFCCFHYLLVCHLTTNHPFPYRYTGPP